MEYLLAGIATAFNFGILKWKVGKGRYFDTILDIVAVVILQAWFSGTLGGMTIAMIASALISLWLLFYPAKFPRHNERVKKLAKVIVITIIVISIISAGTYAYVVFM